MSNVEYPSGYWRLRNLHILNRYAAVFPPPSDPPLVLNRSDRIHEKQLSTTLRFVETWVKKWHTEAIREPTKAELAKNGVISELAGYTLTGAPST